MSKAHVIPAKTDAEYYFKEGCFILECLNDAIDPSVSVARARVRPDASTRWHRLQNTAERYLIQSGQGTVEIDNLSQHVGSGDVVLIPPGCRQRIHNTGTEDLVFLAVCTPRFEPECYEDLGP
ncbi:MAG: cupin domain-containing protein [Oleiphilus sp.]|nr:MAG: cupin domain-containing protein [Oleiphilus sp.]